MAVNTAKIFALAGLVIGACFAIVVFISPAIEATKPKMPEAYADSDLAMHGSRLKGYVLGMEGAVADWYWARSLQYVGAKLLHARESGLPVDIDNLNSLNPRLLYPMLENATELDKNFIGAYSYGAIVLPAIDKEKAVEFVRKGIANNPNEWRLYQHLGYIYWKLGQYEKAAEAYSQGAEIPGAFPFMRLMAASMKTEGGSRETARSIYQQMYDGSDEELVRITAVRRLKELDSLDEREALDKVLADFKEKNGRCANNFGEISAQILQVELPGGRAFRVDKSRRLVDPTDAPYILDREACVVTLDRANTHLPLEK